MTDSPIAGAAPAGPAAGPLATPALPAAAGRVLVLYVHPAPHASRVCRRLAERAQSVDGVLVDELYENYPDFDIDVATERARLLAADAMVLLYPTQWHGSPALLKEWIDAVLHDAWKTARLVSAAGARAPRCCWVVTSTGSSAEDYAPGGRHGRTLADFLLPFEHMARVCGMRWLAPLVLHSAHEVGNAAVEAHASQFVAGLQRLAAARSMAPGEVADGR